MGTRKEKQVNIRLTKEVLNMATKQAKKSGESLSQWIRRIILDKLKL